MLNNSYNDSELRKGAEPSAQHVWHFQQPGDTSRDRWDPVPLTLACETITHDRRNRMTRIHSVFLCPEFPGGANEVMDYARSLADDYGLSVECAVSRGMITVTFERTGSRQ